MPVIVQSVLLKLEMCVVILLHAEVDLKLVIVNTEVV
jgi:hypothetical protein